MCFFFFFFGTRVRTRFSSAKRYISSSSILFLEKKETWLMDKVKCFFLHYVTIFHIPSTNHIRQWSPRLILRVPMTQRVVRNRSNRTRISQWIGTELQCFASYLQFWLQCGFVSQMCRPKCP